MNSREVIDNLLRGKKADRMGLMDSPWRDTMARWVEQGYPTHIVYKEVGEQFWKCEDGRLEDVIISGEYEEPVPAWEHFDYDMVGVGQWFDIMPIRDYNELVSETDEWEIRRNGAGAALKFWKHYDGTPEHVDFKMTSRVVWERDYRPHLMEWDPERVYLKETLKNFASSRQANKWTHYGNLFIWECMRQSLGDINMYESLLLDPGWIHDYNRVYTDFFKKAFAYLIEKVGLPDGLWIYEDLGYKNGLFASPKVLNELFFPYYKELVDFLHGYNLPVVLHSCGSTAEAIPLIIEAGFDALNPMERKAKGNDPFIFAEKYGDKLALIGGLDTRVFETNDNKVIRREVTNYIQGMKARGARLIFASDHSISINTRYESYRYGVEVFRENMWY